MQTLKHDGEVAQCDSIRESTPEARILPLELQKFKNLNSGLVDLLLFLLFPI